MPWNTVLSQETNRVHKRCLIPIFALGMVLGVTILSVAAATLVRVSKRADHFHDPHPRPSVNVQARQQTTLWTLAESISINEVMSYLNELQRIATESNGTRAINTVGFNRTLDFIANYLKANTNYKVTRKDFTVVTKRLARRPILISTINGSTTNHTYSITASASDFYYVESTTSAQFDKPVDLSVVPDLGCTDSDWQKASPPPAGRVALVKRGDCTFVEKGALAAKYKVAALLLYNDGTAADRRSPIFVTLGDNNTLPALFLSFELGQRLANASQRQPNSTTVLVDIQRIYDAPFTTANICADTPTGNSSQTIVIGSHSDSVPEGPGINDNGSGSAANLALAVALARLFRTPAYTKYKYRVRFCWWGAEEVGLLGSDHHVSTAKNATAVGERLSDYLINLNYDMLGSPNYIFGIYDGRTARNDTPAQALPGSNKISGLFRDWFVAQGLPWDYTDFSGRSDYGPFLAEGIVAGGLFSGADNVKTVEQRNRYDAALGQGLGGLADVLQDPCYHKACDSVENINVFAMEKMMQAAAYALEYLGRLDDLKGWLYPSGKVDRVNARSAKWSHLPYV